MHDPDRDPLDTLAEDFVSRYRRGECPSVEDYAQRYPDLAGEIRELLPAAALLEDLKGPPSFAKAQPMPAQLGDYRILREVGRGGMGVVYEAEQGSLGRKVALKVLPADPRLGPEQLERFRREAKAAGRLHHTNIVPVFGVGEHEGNPYYVMQLIAGLGLERVLAGLRAALPRTAPLELPTGADPTSPADVTPRPLVGDPTETHDTETAARFPTSDHAPQPAVPAFNTADYYRFVARLGAQVADALEHAHRHGILHRDVKPANLLLDRDGTVWVTDFGLAKFLEHDDLTRPGEVAGTLRYSAPERFTGRSDARADVYSLGLTLYELLTLRPAYGEPDPSRLLLQVTEGRIAPPRTLNRKVPRDLETVVLRCLAPEPERRYATAGELAADLRRYLDDRPVKARRTGPIEQAWRWCRRNPAVAALSASLLLALLIGFVGVGWKWREASANLIREEEERRRAEDERRRAEGNLDVALEAFDRIARRLASGRPGVPVDSGEEGHAASVVTPEVAAVLNDLVHFHEAFAATNSNDPRLKRETARALRQVGTIRLRLGETDQAVESLTRAAELLAGERDQTLELAQTHNDLGVVLRVNGKRPEALRAHEKAQQILDAWPEPAPQRVRIELARTLSLIGPLQLRPEGPDTPTPEERQAASARAEQTQRRALRLLDALVAEDADNPECRHLLARATYDLAMILVRSLPPREPGKRPNPESPPDDPVLQARRKEISEARAGALKILEELADAFPNVPDYRAEVAEMILSIYPRSGHLKSPQDAETRYAHAVSLAETLTSKHPAVPAYQGLLARAKARLAIAQAAQIDKDDVAGANLRQALVLFDALAERFPNAGWYRMMGQEARLHLGELLRRQDDLDGSAELLRTSLEEAKKTYATATRKGFPRAMLGRHARSLAQTLHDKGDPDSLEEAQRLLMAEELAATKQ